MLSGLIPDTLGACTSLVVLSMAGNNIQGEIPESFSSLRGLEVLNLSRNNLTGQIPNFLADFVFLKTLNLSFNGFEGKLPELGVFKNASTVSIDGNTKLCGGLPEFQLPKCSIAKSSKKNRLPVSLKIIIPILGMISLILLVIIRLVCKSRYWKKGPEETSTDIENFQQVSYRSLHQATDGFSLTNLIGSGRFSSVYKAILNEKNGPQAVAVKVLKLAVHGAEKSFLAECEALRSIRHRNLVKVLTSCSGIDYQGNDFKALIYSYMVNGSLEDWLHQNPVVGPEKEEQPYRCLNFLQRLNIMIDVATAVDYIHCQCGSPMVHCDLKPSNILLDDDLVAHLGDFGLARFLQHTTNDSSSSHASSLGIKGTIGYVAPEHGMGSQMSIYGDIYSFGILILESLTGKRPTDNMFSSSLNLHDFVKKAIPHQVMEVTDLALLETTQEENMTESAQTEECLTSVYRIGTACSMEFPRDRLHIKNVIEQLQIVKITFHQTSG